MGNRVDMKRAQPKAGATRLGDLFDTLDLVMDELARQAETGSRPEDAAALLAGAGLGRARYHYAEPMQLDRAA